jgi:hypothetical protein
MIGIAAPCAVNDAPSAIVGILDEYVSATLKPVMASAEEADPVNQTQKLFADGTLMTVGSVPVAFVPAQ